MNTQDNQAIPAVSVEQLHELLKAGSDHASFDVIDVRQPSEHKICRIDGATLIPLGSLLARAEELDPDKRHYMLCHHGVRSLQAAALLRQQGLDAVNISGGIHAWALRIDPTMAKY